MEATPQTELRIHGHEVAGANVDTAIFVCDDAGQGGAHHEYQVAYLLDEGVGSFATKPLGNVSFQNGPIKEFGYNGVQQEHLLAIVQHRLQCFQAGPFASDYNAVALVHVEAALAALQQRTKDRIARGVEGLNAL